MTCRILLLGTALVVLACSQDTTAPGAPVASVAIVPGALALVPDSTVQLRPVLTDSLGDTLEGRGVTWSVSDSTLLRVSPSGAVTALPPPSWMPWNTAQIRATAEGKTGTAIATVLRRIAGLRVLPDTVTLRTGETAQLSARVMGTTGEAAYAGGPTWTSIDTTRATVDSFGSVRAVRVGVTSITVHAVGLTAAGTVTVIAPVASVTIQPRAPTALVGNAVQYTATVRDSAGNILADRTVTWTEPGRTIAVLTSAGLATATMAGTTPIVATVEGHSDTVSFTATTDGGFAAVAAGEVHTCALTTAGTTYCWGNGFYGQLGTGAGDAGVILSAMRVTGGFHFSSLVARGSHTCALDAAGVAYCWGLDTFGGLGNSAGVAPCAYAEPCRGSPLAVADPAHFATLSAGGFHSCGVTSGGVSLCWGDNVFGQLGIGSADGLAHGPTAVAGTTPFASIAAGEESTCALTAAGTTYCWGAYLSSPVIDSMASDTPQVVPGPLFTELASGAYHLCGLTALGTPYCWGAGLGATPAPVAGASPFAHVYGGGSGFGFTCALDAAGSAYCWGDNSWGQLGDGTTTSSAAPVAVSGGLRFTTLAVGGYHVCGLAVSGVLYCWGDNYNGEIGDGTAGHLNLAPTRVLGQP